MNKRGLLIVLSGPSGTGKGSVVKELVKNNENIKVSVSATTRSPRVGEVHGQDYFFLSKDEFLKIVKNGGMLEHAEYCGNYYGTPKDAVEEWLDQGFDVLLEIEVKGGEQVKKICKDSVGIFIIPPSLQELSDRLVNRKTNSENDIANRLSTATQEIKCAVNYDYTVVNDKIQDCAMSVCDIIKSEKLKTIRNTIINEVLLNE